MKPHPRPRLASRGPRPGAGFTLVEVLVALVAMALLATLSWQAIDGMLRARDAGRLSVDRTVRLGTVIAQWEQDLQAVVDTGVVPGLAYDGQTLRLTRRVDEGVALIAWAVRGGVWQRWAGPAFTRSADLQEGWLRSQQLLGNEPAQVTLAEGVSQWQLYFWRGGGWSNAQSTGNLVPTPAALQAAAAAAAQAASAAASAAAAAASAASGAGTGSSAAVVTPAQAALLREALPEAVQLVVTIDGVTLRRDIAMGPGAAP